VKNRESRRQRQSGAAENRTAGLTARRCDVSLTLHHGVVAGSKACIAGYSAAVWAYYRHVRNVDGSCAKHLTVESYTVIYAANSRT